MRTIFLLFLFLLTTLATSAQTTTSSKEKIELSEKDKNTNNTMRIPTLEIQAYFDSQYLWIESAQTIENMEIAIIEDFSESIVLTGNYGATKVITIPIMGVLETEKEYLIEINIGDLIFTGEFTYN